MIVEVYCRWQARLKRRAEPVRTEDISNCQEPGDEVLSFVILELRHRSKDFDMIMPTRKRHTQRFVHFAWGAISPMV